MYACTPGDAVATDLTQPHAEHVPYGWHGTSMIESTGAQSCTRRNESWMATGAVSAETRGVSGRSRTAVRSNGGISPAANATCASA